MNCPRCGNAMVNGQITCDECYRYRDIPDELIAAARVRDAAPSLLAACKVASHSRVNSNAVIDMLRAAIYEATRDEEYAVRKYPAGSF